MGFKVLVAEDEDITLRNIIEALEEGGFNVQGARNGVEALKKLDAEHFDVLITDIKMPEMSGIELLEKTKEKYPDIKVIITTGFGSISSAIEAIKKGASDYITKPFDLDELTMKVTKINEEERLKKDNLALKTFLGMKKNVSIIA